MKGSKILKLHNNAPKFSNYGNAPKNIDKDILDCELRNNCDNNIGGRRAKIDKLRNRPSEDICSIVEESVDLNKNTNKHESVKYEHHSNIAEKYNHKLKLIENDIKSNACDIKNNTYDIRSNTCDIKTSHSKLCVINNDIFNIQTNHTNMANDIHSVQKKCDLSISHVNNDIMNINANITNINNKFYSILDKLNYENPNDNIKMTINEIKHDHYEIKHEHEKTISDMKIQINGINEKILNKTVNHDYHTGTTNIIFSNILKNPIKCHYRTINNNMILFGNIKCVDIHVDQQSGQIVLPNISLKFKENCVSGTINIYNKDNKNMYSGIIIDDICQVTNNNIISFHLSSRPIIPLCVSFNALVQFTINIKTNK
jgi:hypothetical protein